MIKCKLTADEAPNESKLQKARYHFGNALKLDPSNTVAKGFIDLVSYGQDLIS